MHTLVTLSPAVGTSRASLPTLRRRSGLLGAIAAMCLLWIPLAAFTMAGAAHGSPLTPPSSNAGPEQASTQATAQRDRGWMERTRTWMLLQQRSLHRQLSAGMERLRSAPSATTAGWLILVSFLYGVFHAAGPGHGKAVITTYLLTHRAALRRGIAMSGLSALMQGVTAVLLVFGFVTIAGRLTRDAVNHINTLEQISFAMIAGLGLWLAIRAATRLWGHCRGGYRHCGCHTPHHVDPATLESRWTQFAAIASIGTRPCAGAVIVLAVAHLLDLWLAGVFAVLAMSAGTGLTVALLAILAVCARQWAERATAGRHSGWQLAGHGITLLGGLSILFLGITLFMAAATAPATAPLFMTPRG